VAETVILLRVRQIQVAALVVHMVLTLVVDQAVLASLSSNIQQYFLKFLLSLPAVHLLHQLV
jgi:hypothetical protein